MSVVFDFASDDALAGSLTSPLSSIEISTGRSGEPVGIDAGTRRSHLAVRPLVLRGLRSAPQREILEHVYDPVGQVATDAAGRAAGPGFDEGLDHDRGHAHRR
jgi:hypothetical protein